MAEFKIRSSDELYKAIHIAECKFPNEPINITFETGVYVLDTVNLPRANHGFVHINGGGSVVKFRGGSEGFISVPKDNSEALNVFMSTRYLFENFSRIEGGVRGIHIGATFNTVLRNLQCVGQREAGIEIQFGLMTRLENVLITNPMYDGIRLGIGDWKGSTRTNSQSNHSVLEQCRVYNRAGGNYSFDIQNSSGVVLRDCIAEGRANLRAVNFNAYGNPVVKNFTIENFHLEYAPTEGGIWISASATTCNVIDKYYISSNNIQFPIVTEYNAPIQIKNLSWWKSSYKIKCTHHAPRILIDQSTWHLNAGSVMTTAGRPLFKSYIRVSNQITS